MVAVVKATNPELDEVLNALYDSYRILIGEKHLDISAIDEQIRKTVKMCQTHGIDPYNCINGQFGPWQPGPDLYNALTRFVFGDEHTGNWFMHQLRLLISSKIPDLAAIYIARECRAAILNGAYTYSYLTALIINLCQHYQADPDWLTMDERVQIGQIFADYGRTGWPPIAQTLMDMAARSPQR